MFSVPGNHTGHLGSHCIMPVPLTSPFCPNCLRKQSEVKPGKFCRNGLVTSMILCVRVSISLDIRYLPAMQETEDMRIQSLSWEDALEKEVATHSSILAWKSHGQKRQAIVHGVTKSLTILSTHRHTHRDKHNIFKLLEGK